MNYSELKDIFSINTIVGLFKQGSQRSVRAKKNILYSFFIKCLSIITSLMFIPLTINYLNTERYGVWITLTSVIGWIMFFDIGLANGLRNKLAEAYAKGEEIIAKTYISTTYALLTIIIVPLTIVFLIANNFIDWCIVFNAPAYMAHELKLLAAVIFVFLALQFVLKVIVTIVIADQKSSISDFIYLIINIISLASIYILTKTQINSFLLMGSVLSFVPVLVFLVTSLVFFSGRYKSLKPSFANIDFKYFNSLISLSFKFFIIQISFIVIFLTTNILISQLFGPSEVTIYNVVFRYFSVITILCTIIYIPFWSAYTEAYTKNDITWMRSTTRKLIYVWFGLAAFIIVMLLFSTTFYKLWLGKSLQIPFSLSAMMAIYVILKSWTSVFVYLINGIGKLRLQLIDSIFQSIIIIPLAIFFAKHLQMGVNGVVLALCFSLFTSSIWLPIQYYLIINNKAKGIWFK